MSQFNEELRNALHEGFPKKARLTESEKSEIMDRVRALKGKKPRKKLDVLPKTLTAIAAAGFIFFAGGLAAKEFGYLRGNPGENIAITDPYQSLEQGDFFKGWEVIEKNNSKLVFEGYAQLTGTLTYNSGVNGSADIGVVFIPDKDSARLLPTPHGEVRWLSFDSKGKDTVSTLYGITPDSTADNVTIEISGYTALLQSNGDEAAIIQFKNAVDQKEPARTFTPRKIPIGTNGKLELNEELSSIYNEFSRTHNDSLLEGWDPFSVFLLYVYAEQESNYKTKYYLHNTSIESPFSSVGEYISESEKELNKEGSLKLLTTVREAGIVKEEVRSDGTAGIYISEQDGLGYFLSKDNKGIWKLNWMAIQ